MGKLEEVKLAYEKGLSKVSRHFLDKSEPYRGYWWDEWVVQELDRRFIVRYLSEAGLMADDMWHLNSSPGE